MRIIIQGENAAYVAELITSALAAENIDAINYAYEDGVVPVRGNYTRVSVEVHDQPLPGASNAYEEQVKP